MLGAYAAATCITAYQLPYSHSEAPFANPQPYSHSGGGSQFMNFAKDTVVVARVKNGPDSIILNNKCGVQPLRKNCFCEHTRVASVPDFKSRTHGLAKEQRLVPAILFGVIGQEHHADRLSFSVLPRMLWVEVYISSEEKNCILRSI